MLTKRNGKKLTRQSYKCNDCSYQFLSARRRTSELLERIFLDYADGKQSYLQLSQKYHLSIKTIQSRLQKYKIINPEYEPSETVIIMDTTYFRRDFGVMVFRDAYQRRNLHWTFVNYETVKLYETGIKYLQSKGWNIKALVCDGRRGLFKAFSLYHIQMCHFHQCAIIRRYLTQNPRLEANIELKELSSLLMSIDKNLGKTY